jgi:hypothetical protein
VSSAISAAFLLAPSSLMTAFLRSAARAAFSFLSAMLHSASCLHLASHLRISSSNLSFLSFFLPISPFSFSFSNSSWRAWNRAR